MPARQRLIASFVAQTKGRNTKKRLVDEQNYPNPAPFFVPGFGDVAPTKRAIKAAQQKAQHDSYPYPHGPFNRKKRRPTRPNPRPNDPQLN